MHAKKSFGQHFLHNAGVLDAIVRALDIRPDELVCEIGPGTGQLTDQLLKVVPTDKLFCVEADPDMVTHLNAKHPGLSVVHADAVNFAWDSVVPDPVENRAVAVGNLPYNASTAIYFNMMLMHRHRFRRMVFMFQWEVAERLKAGPGNKTFGPPSVITQVLADVTLVTKVSPGSFRPPPKVDSAVLCIEPLSTPRFEISELDIGPFNAFVHAMFKHRRKTIHNNLKILVGSKAKPLLVKAGIHPMARAETLGPETLVRLWRSVLGSSS